MTDNRAMRPIRNHSPSGELDENLPDSGILRRTRRRLQDKFENQFAYEQAPSSERSRGVSWVGMTVPRIPARVLRSGASTLTRTLNSVQTTFGSLSQPVLLLKKFRRSTKRRQQLKNETSYSPVTPQSKTRYILGRTPTKLYSPFGIETPCRRAQGKENEYSKTRTPKDMNCQLNHFYDLSKENHSACVILKETVVIEKKFDPDMEEVRVGIWELRQMAHRIVKRSSAQH